MHPLEYIFDGRYSPIPLWLSILLLLIVVSIILFGGEWVGMGKNKLVNKIRQKLQDWYGESQDVPLIIFSIAGIYLIVPTFFGYPGIGIVVSAGIIISCIPLLIPQLKEQIE